MDKARSIDFYKYEGTGNDFVILHDPSGQWRPPPDRIRAWCDRRFGIGADGLIVIRPARDADYRMDYYNADGNIGSMCGNGARCAFHLAQQVGLSGATARFAAYDGLHTAHQLPDGRIRISMQDVDRMTMSGDAFVLDTGSPHYVRFVDVIDNVDVLSEGRTIRHSPPFGKEGINVNFVQVDAEGLILRTYERGVEDITLSCGTGATAAVLAFATLRELARGPVAVHVLGGSLEVGFVRKADGGYGEITLSGPARCVFTGSLLLTE